MEGEKVLMKVSPMKRVMRFGKKCNLISKFIGPFEVLERVGEVAYRLDLPPILAELHLVFYVYILWRYNEDKSHVLDFRTTYLEENLDYIEEPVAILDRQVRKLRPKETALVEVDLMFIRHPDMEDLFFEEFGSALEHLVPN
ncbi:PREDICTED: uncharacterized protein LOC109209799 [Nicotiana attenuata]|uniref:uncharacterized protein LOC109209799 n=1 Tax=Nicotiana attenuata TaxID=49451 RepID=UPI000904730C|nr:PREDICTED: uncharacterized protein LOC109209799 [Nicotiana attenuata]